MKVKVWYHHGRPHGIEEREECPAGYACGGASGRTEVGREPHPEGGEIVTYDIEVFPAFAKEDTRWVTVNLPAQYRIHRWASGGTFGTHLDSLEDSVSIPVKVRVQIEGGGPFIYGGLLKMNEGSATIVEVVGIDWEVGEYEIRFPNTKPSYPTSCLRGISMPRVPSEVDRIDMEGIEAPEPPEPLERRFFAAKRELLKQGGNESLERQWPDQEPQIRTRYEADLAAYEQANAAYDELRAVAQLERETRIRQWKADNNILPLSELAAYIEAEIRRYFDE